MTEKANQLVERYVEDCAYIQRAGTEEYQKCIDDMNRSKAALDAYIHELERKAALYDQGPPDDLHDFRPEDEESPG